MNQVLVFEEKYGSRYIYGNSKEEIAQTILKERIEDTMGYGLSVWYGEDTENAQRALDNNKAYEYLVSRKTYEYENFYEAILENS